MAKKCETCKGTGKIRQDRSWFKSDGYYYVTCWVCRGLKILRATRPSREERES
jgi:hypothetical protein